MQNPPRLPPTRDPLKSGPACNWSIYTPKALREALAAAATLDGYLRPNGEPNVSLYVQDLLSAALRAREIERGRGMGRR